ncbi:hypothetical protein AMAG_03863 [Allomyces macrogynus ATCC 38327]|uniref:SEC63 domain-containing protein n=1 Tax=Allomyces macrogynus (strain ATCC 38327) TaxID=578462 RepID=A0A0L0SB26_ALLM3|nr:hypothetical protein AMAG_03863 [Allomyces macrogynus ATCC 38327]|eukprot:KNE59604.1 hypothetical protein AMAG_03863 [Allomyces macrogynus ATCC 38327]
MVAGLEGQIAAKTKELEEMTADDIDDEQLLYHVYFVLKSKFAAEDHHFSFTVPLFEPLAPNYFITVVSDSWLSSETRIAVSFRNLLLPTKFAPSTEMPDLQPFPTCRRGVAAGTKEV